jgi:hypothetical protein
MRPATLADLVGAFHFTQAVLPVAGQGGLPKFGYKSRTAKWKAFMYVSHDVPRCISASAGAFRNRL